MRNHILALLVITFSLTSAAADKPFPGVKALMSEDEYRAAGMEKLSDAERTALNAWLITYTVGEAPVLRKNNTEVREAEKSLTIEASIKQPFSGWSGKTVFTLDNGQRWRQRLEGRYSYNGKNTEVVIRKNFFGFYKMTLVSTGAAVGVSRIN
ncbi:MAG: hypothetical protein ACI9B9_001878 [Halioglobus sp.]|jgi:hypothetical protein